MAPANEVPSFFKGILFQESTQRLRLPKAFGEYLKGRLSSKVFLRNPYRDLWPVEMARSETGEYTFEEGWSRFFEQNKLEYKDFMIFQYDGNSVFDFKIYGNNMDEKEYTRFPEVKPDPDEVEQPLRRQLQQPRQPPRPRKQPRQQQQQRRPEVVQRKEMEPERELEHEVEREPELNEVKQPRQPQQPRQPLQQKQRRPEAVQREKMEHEREVEQDVEPEPEPDKVEKLQQPHQRPLQQPRQPQQQKQRCPEVVQHVEMEPERELELEQEVEREPEPEVEREYEPMEVDDHEEDDDDFLFETEEQINARNKKRRKRAPPIKEADQDVVFESGEIPRPDNPYFVTQRRPGRNELYIPIDVVTAFDLKLSETLILCDEKNRKWPAKVHVWKDGRIWLSGGWKTICKWNTVKPTDMCLCEFIPATQEHDMFLKIRVVPDAALRRPARKSS